MTEGVKPIFDLSLPRRRYYSEDCGLTSCPECGLPLIEYNCPVLIAAKPDSDENEFLSNLTGSHFCNSCPVVVFDSEKLEYAVKVGIKGDKNLRYLICGIVNFKAIPEEKSHLAVGTDENPVPLVHFLPDLDESALISEKERNQDLSEQKRNQHLSEKKTGRNDPCPCGSGKKYKKCCG